MEPINYIKNFTWENTKLSQSRSLVELAGLISDRMKLIDNDIKKLQDELTEHRNNYSQLVKKEGNNFLTQDISEAIYTKVQLNVQENFVEKLGSETFATVIAIVHRLKVDAFKQTYEKVIPWNNETQDFSVVPRSARSLDIEDKDGNQLWRFVVLRERLEEYLEKGRKAGLVLRKFTYDYERY